MLVTSDSGARTALSASECFKCHPTHGEQLAFLPQELSNPIKRPFSGQVRPAQRMICHLTLLPVTVLTSRSYDNSPEGHGIPHSSGPMAVTKPCCLEPHGLQMISLVSWEGGLPATNRHGRLCSSAKLGELGFDARG